MFLKDASPLTWSANTMEISLRQLWEIKVYHHVHSLDINTSGKQICKDNSGEELCWFRVENLGTINTGQHWFINICCPRIKAFYIQFCYSFFLLFIHFKRNARRMIKPSDLQIYAKKVTNINPVFAC